MKIAQTVYALCYVDDYAYGHKAWATERERAKRFPVAEQMCALPLSNDILNDYCISIVNCIEN